eukprot:scaffold704_cov347-Prasinococcus_capsulatus_cf.AAC.36
MEPEKPSERTVESVRALYKCSAAESAQVTAVVIEVRELPDAVAVKALSRRCASAGACARCTSTELHAHYRLGGPRRWWSTCCRASAARSPPSPFEVWMVARRRTRRWSRR